ncbi:unnamed protein product [Gongylonema pulchrum]|uniref:Col_cuticle_N domain-containing protein n=1 Tax=Gongylonema pulchrum TaxID=637853 RepID=A0A183ENN8_9BILA|nr:unnamed protein product [Gongylonema pulchrum]
MDKALRMEQEAASLRRIAFAGVALSTTASLICIISVPLFYNYLQRVQSNMQQEVDFCKQRSGNIWKESNMQQEVDFCKQRSGNIWKEVSRTQVFSEIL